MVLRHNGYHGPAFPATWGTTQGGLVSPTLLNAVVDNVIRIWLSMTVEYQRVSRNGLVEAVGRCLGVFCANYGMVGSINPDWLQHSMNVLVSLFQQYGLSANVAKSLSMMCQPGALRFRMSVEAKVLKFNGVVDSYHVRLQRRIPCPKCGVYLTTGSIMAHHCFMHGTEPSMDWNRLTVSQTEHPRRYTM